MKLYHINPNDFGAEYFIMTTSKEAALVELKRYYIKMASDETNDVRDIYQQDYDKLWKDADVDNLPKRYTIDEHGFGDIVETEIC